MKLEKININKLIKYENNPRNNEEAIDYVKKSIENYGYINPILINKENIILAGHTRYDALKKLEIEEIDVIRIDDLDEDEEKAFRIADNKVAEYSSWDNKKLLDELKNFTDEMKEQLKELGLEYNIDEIKIDDDLFISEKEIEEKHIICPHCGGEIK